MGIVGVGWEDTIVRCSESGTIDNIIIDRCCNAAVFLLYLQCCFLSPSLYNCVTGVRPAKMNERKQTDVGMKIDNDILPIATTASPLNLPSTHHHTTSTQTTTTTTHCYYSTTVPSTSVTMRFKAKLASEQVSLLYSLIGSLSRLNSTKETTTSRPGMLMGGTVLRLDESKVLLSTKGKNDADGVSVFCELATHDGLFMEHRIQSVEPNNAIAMEVDLTQIRMALQSILANDPHESQFHNKNNNHQADHIGLNHYTATILKLQKKQGIPCLCLDAFTRDGIVEVHHSIPVRIMRVQDAIHHLPPRVDSPDVQLQMIPPDRPLRILAERLKHVCPHVYLEASNVTGELTLTVDNEGTHVRAFFGKLVPLQDEQLSNSSHTPKDRCVLKVDTKKLVSCLQWQQSAMIHNVDNALLCFIENQMLVVHVAFSPSSLGFLTYYVPVHFLTADDNDTYTYG